MNTKSLLQNCLKLLSVEFNKDWDDSTRAQIAKLHGQIPPRMLGHYALMGERDKKGVTAVRNQVCTSCRVRVPRATAIYLMWGEDIGICNNCEAYTFLSEWVQIEGLADGPTAKPTTNLPLGREPAHAA